VAAIADQSHAGVERQGETLAERNNRNLSDLLQELRVAGLGVQMLFGFLLSLPFTMRFAKLDAAQQDLYKSTLLCTALATALLIAPVAYHRWVFRRHEKGHMLKLANVFALLGLAAVALAVTLAIWLVLSFIGASWIVAVFAAVTSSAFAFLWFALPIFERLTSDPTQYD
jgi:O-antigen/teichoic acid export membrane protein